MGKYKVSIITTIALSCLFFASCASYQKYPSEWAELILPQDERCLDISGTYMNLGEKADKQSTYLSTLFDSEETPSTMTKIQIIQLDNDKLEISAWYEQKLVSKKAYSKRNKEYSCSSRGVEIPIGKGEKTVGGAGESIIIYLAKSTDGALVIERKSSTGGYSLLYIPMVGSTSEWFRFKPIDIRKP